MGEKVEPLSQALQFVQMVWNHSFSSTSHSWLKLNHSLMDALLMAARCGMRFGGDDFDYISRHWRPGYWLNGEHFYEKAVLYRNTSAYQAYEKHRGRKPFIVKGACLNTHTGDGPAGGGLARLILGAEFVWDGRLVKVTSFNDLEGSLVACSYKTEGEWKHCKKCGRGELSRPETKLEKRYTITHADLRAARKKAA